MIPRRVPWWECSEGLGGGFAIRPILPGNLMFDLFPPISVPCFRTFQDFLDTKIKTSFL